jgi:hypothetical protein
MVGDSSIPRGAMVGPGSIPVAMMRLAAFLGVAMIRPGKIMIQRLAASLE